MKILYPLTPPPFFSLAATVAEGELGKGPRAKKISPYLKEGGGEVRLSDKKTEKEKFEFLGRECQLEGKTGNRVMCVPFWAEVFLLGI